MTCMASTDSKPFGNMAAVGSYGTGIEIWDMDVIDSVEPAAVLGGPAAGADSSAQPKPKKKKKPGKKVLVRRVVVWSVTDHGFAQHHVPDPAVLLRVYLKGWVAARSHLAPESESPHGHHSGLRHSWKRW